MKPWAEGFYKSAAWKHCRELCMRRDAYLCRDCLANGVYRPAEEVHHIVELTPENISDPAVSLNPANLVSLCRECHRARHGKAPKRYKVDEMGRVEIL